MTGPIGARLGSACAGSEGGMGVASFGYSTVEHDLILEDLARLSQTPGRRW
jgi:hypothetical protein